MPEFCKGFYVYHPFLIIIPPLRVIKTLSADMTGFGSQSVQNLWSVGA